MKFPKDAQPYQLLFPIGVAAAVTGTLLWIPLVFGMGAYPGPAHAQVMMSGFLTSFAVGFLMTAIPRFTGSTPASRLEMGIATLLSLLSIPISIRFSGTGWADLWVIGLFLFLASFGAQRFTQRSFDPPPSFVFLPVGILLAVLGSALSLAGQTQTGHFLFYHGTVLSFVLGVGSKLVSALLGQAPEPLIQLGGKGGRRGFLHHPALHAGLATLFLAGFVSRALGARNTGMLLVSLVVTWTCLVQWKLYRALRTRTKLSGSLWVSGWFLLLGNWSMTLFPGYEVHLAHLEWIGGLGLMTLTIASRVTLSHGGYDLALENRVFPFVPVIALLAIAAFTRATSIFTQTYLHHLGFAVIFWILGILCWSLSIFPKLFRTGESSEY